MKRSILLPIIIFLSILSFMSAQAQLQMPMPTAGSQYNGYIRGFWFVAPVNFKIVGLKVPSGSTVNGNQCFQIVKINDPMPIAFTAQSSNFDTYLYTNNATYGQVYPCNVLIEAGDTIGILGGTANGTNNSNAYGTGSYTSTIFGYNVPIQRFGYQGYIVSGQAPSVWGVGYQASGNVSRIEVYYTTAGIEEYPYCEGFEGGDGGWSSGGILNSWEHGEPDNTLISAAAGGDNAWVTNLDGDYNNDEFSYVQSISFDLSPLEDPAVRFMAISDIETNDDGATFQVSTDSGSTWSTLGSTSSPGNWYTSSSISSFNALNSSHGWTGTNSAWTQMAHSLSAYQGDTSVFFRYVLSADGAATQEGFGFDDILVAESNDVALTQIWYPDSVCGNSNDVITASLCNLSVEPRFGFDVLVDTNGSTVTYSYPDTIPVCGCDTVDLLSFNTSQGGNWDLDVIVDNSGDVNSSNDTMSTTVVAYGIPGGSLSGGGSYCEGEIAQLTFAFTGVGPWNLQYSNGTTPTYISGVSSPFTASVFTSGTYTITYLQDSTGCPTDSASISGSAEILFNPAPVVNLGPDSTVCGDYQLDAGAGYTNYSWSTGESTQTIDVTSPNTYSVTVTDTNGCEGSDEVVLQVNPNPEISLPDTVICEGGTFIFNAGGGFQGYLWHDGSTGQVFQTTSVGTVSVTVTDFNDCEGDASGSILSIEPNPEPTVTGNAGPPPVTLNAGSGYFAYEWSNGATTQTISVSNAGTYTCTVTDSNGCEGSDDAKAKIWPNAVEELGSSDWKLYPNPIQTDFTIEFGSDMSIPSSMSLIDMKGDVVQTYLLSMNRIQFLEADPTISSGHYLLRLGDGSDGEEIQVTIQN